jgi:hypothetical protein
MHRGGLSLPSASMKEILGVPTQLEFVVRDVWRFDVLWLRLELHSWIKTPRMRCFLEMIAYRLVGAPVPHLSHLMHKILR